MRLEWLEDILAIGQTGSFSAAAEQRRLTQSAFSRRIKQIEDHIGVELFDRSRKPVVLHPTTLAQRDQMALLIAALRQLEVDLRRGERIVGNKIVIASQHSLTTSFTPAIIQGIQLRGEETYVRLRSANLDECFSLLLSRQADVAIHYHVPGHAPEISDSYFETLSLGADRLIPVFARALAGKPDLPYIAYPPDVFFGKVIEAQIAPYLPPGLTLLPMAETALTLAALEMAVIGLAVAWVPQSLALERIATGQLIDLSGDLPSCGLQIRAARLHGATGRAELAFWDRLATLPSA